MPYYYSKVFIQNCFPVDVVDSPYLIAVLTDSVVCYQGGMGGFRHRRRRGEDLFHPLK